MTCAYGVRCPAGRVELGSPRTSRHGFSPSFTGRVLPFDEAATSSDAEIRAAARRAGTAIGDLDAIIAAIARTRGYAIATRDVTPFERADVPVINPFAGG